MSNSLSQRPESSLSVSPTLTHIRSLGLFCSRILVLFGRYKRMDEHLAKFLEHLLAADLFDQQGHALDIEALVLLLLLAEVLLLLAAGGGVLGAGGAGAGVEQLVDDDAVGVD